MPKRSEQKRENRLRIINAYIELLGQKDLRQITVADICTQAAVARKTLYSHFASKEDILDAVSQRVMFTGAIRAFRPEARAGETTLARLEDTFKQLGLPLATYRGQNIDVFVQLIQNMTMHLSTYSGLYGEFHKAAYDYFESCRQSDDTRHDFDVGFVADLAVNAAVGIILSWVSDQNYPAEQRMTELKQHIASLILVA